MNTCPHCKKAIEEEPRLFALPFVTINGKEQRIVERIKLTPKRVRFVRLADKNYKRRVFYGEEIPVVCIEERER